MLSLRRGIHTRPKKVKVQLLKTFPSVGLRGEVLDVKEGLMRHKLHPGNGAAYVRENEPLQIPLLTRDEAQRLTKAAEASAKVALEREQAEQPAQASEPRENKVKSLLDSLSFPTATRTEAKTAGAEVKREVTREAKAEAAEEEPKKLFEWQNEFVVNMTDKK